MCYNDTDFNQFPNGMQMFRYFYLTKREDFINCEGAKFQEKRFG